MKRIVLILAVATTIAYGCHDFGNQVHGFPDLPWYIEPFLYCFIGTVMPR
jgi:hypothetical protein